MRSIARPILRSCSLASALALISSAAGAASIPAYTATDLGSSVTLSSTGADGTLTTSTGVVYAFPRTDNQVANPQSLLATFPPLTNAPISDSATNGNSQYAFSYLDSSGVFLNKVGQFAATDLVGVDGHVSGSSASIIDTATRQADGTFGPLTAIASTPNNTYTGGQVARVLDLNNAGQLLGIDLGSDPAVSNYHYSDLFLYDLQTKVRTEVSSLLPPGWTFPIPMTALDDQGRILVTAQPVSPNIKGTELFLLTPAGVSSNPIPSPEPTAFVTLAIAGLGLAIRRRWKS